MQAWLLLVCLFGLLMRPGLQWHDKNRLNLLKLTDKDQSIKKGQNLRMTLMVLLL